MKRRSGLTRSDLALWVAVAKTVRPMPGRQNLLLPEPEDEAFPTSTREAENTGRPHAMGVKVPVANRLEPFDSRVLQQVRRGRLMIDARLDLHGLRQGAAHRKLRDFLHTAQAHDHRLVLVITGKGSGLPTDGGEREVGVLKRMVPMWLAAPDLRTLVLSYEAAAQGHGGDGALYVRLRRLGGRGL